MGFSMAKKVRTNIVCVCVCVYVCVILAATRYDGCMIETNLSLKFSLVIVASKRVRDVSRVSHYLSRTGPFLESEIILTFKTVDLIIYVDK